jgi:hydroxypyruvate isomerase
MAEKLKGNINHAVCRWCYGDISVENLCAAAKDIGIKGIDLVGPATGQPLKNTGCSPACATVPK